MARDYSKQVAAHRKTHGPRVSNARVQEAFDKHGVTAELGGGDKQIGPYVAKVRGGRVFDACWLSEWQKEKETTMAKRARKGKKRTVRRRYAQEYRGGKKHGGKFRFKKATKRAAKSGTRTVTAKSGNVWKITRKLVGHGIRKHYKKSHKK